MLKMILDKALDKYSLQGFELKEYDDDFLVLYHQGEEILRLNQTSHQNTPEYLQGQCEAHLFYKHSAFGITFGGVDNG